MLSFLACTERTSTFTYGVRKYMRGRLLWFNKATDDLENKNVL